MDRLYPGVYIEELPSGSRTITGVPTSVAAFIGRALSGPANKATAINSWSNYTSVFGGLSKDCNMSYAVYQFFENGGSNAIIVRVDAGAGKELTQQDLIGDSSAKTGLYALKSIDIFNLLCIPSFDAEDKTRNSVYEAALAICEEKRAILLVDPPKSWTDKSQALGGIQTYVTTHKNAAIYFPRIKAKDPTDQTTREFDPCGAVAGIIARTDAQRGVWKAPAGTEANLVGVADLAVQLSDADNGDLNVKGINCLRKLPAAGLVVWGARTMRGDDRWADEWKYLSVRRTALFIEESLFRGTQWVVFEPNNEALWSQIRLNVGAFMAGLWRKGAFQGKTPQEAYLVKCDAETTTQDDINKGVVNIIVGFAPIKPAEFIIIKIQIQQANPKTLSTKQRQITKPPITTPKFVSDSTLR